MSKYNSLKFLKETKARIFHTCDKCSEEIKKGEIYYSESISKVNAPRIKLKKFCYKCGKKLLNLRQEAWFG
jgi:ribosomal protein L33